LPLLCALVQEAAIDSATIKGAREEFAS